jgi:hypothetical protein
MITGGNDFDPQGPMKEAAMFYGLFLRGHSLEALRRDIDMPRTLVEKWLKTPKYEPELRDKMRQVYSYRKQVLAIFEELVTYE